MGNEPYDAPINGWIKARDDPWNHVSTTGGVIGGDHVANLPGPGALSRRPGTDSGYESHVRQSIGARSIIGDSDARSIAAPLSTLQYQGLSENIQDARAGAFPQAAYNQSQSAQSVGFTTSSSGGQLACRHCGDTVKTKSELK
jgi:hypothetical protein